MDQKLSDTSPDTLPMEPRPPFNEISILFPLLTLYTVAYLGLMAAEFVLRGAFVVPAGMMPVYIALVGAYAADKEIRRWAIGDQPSRKGALFVYLWMLFFLAAFVLHSFRVDFAMPGELSKVVLQVLGIFFGSRASKYIHGAHRSQDPEVIGLRETEILEIIKGSGKVTTRDVAAKLQISHRTASRLLTGMADKGLVRRVGERKASYYVLS